MAGKSQKRTGRLAAGAPPSRLELIKRRHRELILKPREALASDYGHEFEDPFDDVLGADELETEAMALGRL
jgi:hypothetical protein